MLALRAQFAWDDGGGKPDDDSLTLVPSVPIHMKMSGPHGHVCYAGGGKLYVHGALKRMKRVGAIVGGTGITPVMQVLRALRTERDTRVWNRTGVLAEAARLIACNRNARD